MPFEDSILVHKQNPGKGAPPTADDAVPQSPGEAAPIRGGSLRIAENMEASLSIPTATSVREIPVRTLETS